MACILKKDFTTQEELFQYIHKSLDELISQETHWIANAANAASLLYFMLEDLNWVGFYLCEDEELVLGPFCGKPAVTRIAIGSGVCGDAAKAKQTIRVEDVHQYEGHIACDLYSNSEIVIPLIYNDKLIGVLDIDSPEIGRFSQEDQDFLEVYAKVLSEKILFPQKS